MPTLRDSRSIPIAALLVLFAIAAPGTLVAALAPSAPLAPPLLPVGDDVLEPLVGAVDPADPRGVTLDKVVPGGAAERAGLRPGDRLVAIDGRRIHDLAEFIYARRSPPPDGDVQRLVSVRDGVVNEVILDGRTRTPRILVDFSSVALNRRLTAAMLGAGVQPDRDAQARARLPGRAADALSAWLKAHPGPAPGWVDAFLAAHAAALACRGPAPAEVAIPVPFLARLDALHRAVIARGAAGATIAELGVEPAFAALYFPYPAVAVPEMGTMRLSDVAFQVLLARRRSDPIGSQADRQREARQMMAGDDASDHFLGLVKAALIDPDNHGGWPFRYEPLWDAASRKPLVEALRQRHAASGADAPLVAFALVGPLMIDGLGDEVSALIASMRAASPYLAQRACVLAANAGNMHRKRAATADVRQRAIASGVLPRPAWSWIYDRCAAGSASLRQWIETEGLAGEGLQLQLVSQSAEVARALSPDGALVDGIDGDHQRLADDLNNVAWILATDGAVADGGQAWAVARQLLAVRGGRLPPRQMDTVAACLARAGDVQAAVHWQAAAVADAEGNVSQKDLNGFANRLEVFRAGGAFTERQIGVLAPVDAVVAGGRRIGQRRDGKRVGLWRTLRADGSLAESGMFHDDRQVGCWRRFDAGDVLREETTFAAGARCGRWSLFHADGTPAESGWYQGGDDGQRTGTWQLHHSTGAVAERGLYRKGRREGAWQRWDAAGTLIETARFVAGKADGAWQGRPEAVEVPPGTAAGADFF